MSFKYRNVGYTRLLTSTNVYQIGPFDEFKFGGYGYGQADEAACFGIPAASEIWIRCDFYHGDAGPMYAIAYIGDKTTAYSGIRFSYGENGLNYAEIYADGALVHTATDYALGLNTTHAYWLHMKSDASDGLIEYYCLDTNDSSILSTYTYTGPLNGGADFSNVYTAGSFNGQFFGNVVVADEPVALNEMAALSITIQADTKRALSSDLLRLVGDTRRRVGSNTAIMADTARRLTNTVTIYADTERQLPILIADTRREILRSVVLTADTRRNLQVILTADTRRMVGNRVSITSDTKRRFARVVQTDFTVPPYPTDGITGINLQLSESTLTDTASYGTVIQTTPNDELRGYILDFPYSFIVQSTTQSGLEQTAKCTYDIDALLYTPFKLTKSSTTQSQTFALKVAAALGKGLQYIGDNFTYRNTIGGDNQTYKSLISNVYGWSSRVPRMQYNVFLRGGNLCVMQRGAEVNTVDIDALQVASMPTIERELIRTIWSYGLEEETEDHAIIRRGAYIDGGDDEYNNETVDYEQVNTPSGSTDSRPAMIQRYNEDGSYTLIEYSYQWTGRDYVLKEEQEHTYDADGNLLSHSITYHEIISGGWRNSVTVAMDEDGNTIGVGSTGARTRPGDMKTSAYADQVKLARGGKWKGVTNGIEGGQSLVDTDFPVDDAMQERCLNEIRWMNLRIKETVTLELCPPIVSGIPVYQHVIDFTDKIRWQGNDYYLLSNAVSFTPTSHRQTLKVVRWF